MVSMKETRDAGLSNEMKHAQSFHRYMHLITSPDPMQGSTYLRTKNKTARAVSCKIRGPRSKWSRIDDRSARAQHNAGSCASNANHFPWLRARVSKPEHRPWKAMIRELFPLEKPKPKMNDHAGAKFRMLLESVSCIDSRVQYILERLSLTQRIQPCKNLNETHRKPLRSNIQRQTFSVSSTETMEQAVWQWMHPTPMGSPCFR